MTDERQGKTSRVYEAIDGTIMKGVNKVVNAWNWTTGDTKKDLANKLVTTSPVLETVAFISLSPLHLIALPPSIMGTIWSRKQNKLIYESEGNALKSGTISIEAEKYKEVNKKAGPIFLGIAGGMYSFLRSGIVSEPFMDESIAAGAYASGALLRAASCYVIRADNLPPRKNCLSRGKEKLEKMISEYSPKPQLNTTLT